MCRHPEFVRAWEDSEVGSLSSFPQPAPTSVGAWGQRGEAPGLGTHAAKGGSQDSNMGCAPCGRLPCAGDGGDPVTTGRSWLGTTTWGLRARGLQSARAGRVVYIPEEGESATGQRTLGTASRRRQATSDQQVLKKSSSQEAVLPGRPCARSFACILSCGVKTINSPFDR